MMKKFVNDIFSEETSKGVGKFSSKRFMGIIVGLLAATGAIVSGLDWYTVASEILNPMWAYSGTMLGISIAKGILSK